MRTSSHFHSITMYKHDFKTINNLTLIESIYIIKNFRHQVIAKANYEAKITENVSITTSLIANKLNNTPALLMYFKSSQITENARYNNVHQIVTLIFFNITLCLKRKLLILS